MEHDLDSCVYKCKECGARQIIILPDAPSPCIECGPEAEKIDKGLRRVFAEEDAKRRADERRATIRDLEPWLRHKKDCPEAYDCVTVGKGCTCGLSEKIGLAKAKGE